MQEAVGPDLAILSGGEIHVWSDLLSSIERLPETGVMPLAGSRCLLLEFRGTETPAEGANLVHELCVAGWLPIVAHPEFIPWIAEDLAVVERLVSLGALTQVTAMSVTGDFGARPMTSTHRMLEEGLVHFVASDCHGPRRRPPGLRRARQLIAGRWGEDLARQLVADNPRGGPRRTGRSPVSSLNEELDEVKSMSNRLVHLALALTLAAAGLAPRAAAGADLFYLEPAARRQPRL